MHTSALYVRSEHSADATHISKSQINYLLLCTSLMVQAKKLQLKQEARRRQRQQQSSDNAAGGTVPAAGTKKDN
jgi:hypothetical protein